MKYKIGNLLISQIGRFYIVVDVNNSFATLLYLEDVYSSVVKLTTILRTKSKVYNEQWIKHYITI